jgi:hypothetical protein
VHGFDGCNSAKSSEQIGDESHDGTGCLNRIQASKNSGKQQKLARQGRASNGGSGSYTMISRFSIAFHSKPCRFYATLNIAARGSI